MTLVPQLTLLNLTEYLSWNSPPYIRIKWAVFLLVLAGISLVTSVVAAGLAGGLLTILFSPLPNVLNNLHWLGKTPLNH